MTWIHGRHDAWMDLERARQVLSCGDTSKRRLIEIPVGHQMRSSQMALESFQLIAGEAVRILRGRPGKPALPDLAGLEGRRLAERARVKGGPPDLHAFWQDYLLGRGRDFGIDLMAAMSPYEDLMALQVTRLDLAPGARVVDLGAGTGALVNHLASSARTASAHPGNADGAPDGDRDLRPRLRRRSPRPRPRPRRSPSPPRAAPCARCAATST